MQGAHSQNHLFCPHTDEERRAYALQVMNERLTCPLCLTRLVSEGITEVSKLNGELMQLRTDYEMFKKNPTSTITKMYVAAEAECQELRKRISKLEDKDSKKCATEAENTYGEGFEDT